jgi:hypothetical protein
LVLLLLTDLAGLVEQLVVVVTHVHALSLHHTACKTTLMSPLGKLESAKLLAVGLDLLCSDFYHACASFVDGVFQVHFTNAGLEVLLDEVLVDLREAVDLLPVTGLFDLVGVASAQTIIDAKDISAELLLLLLSNLLVQQVHCVSELVEDWVQIADD